MTGRVLLAALLAGWLADRLARPDRDVEAGIEAYEAGELDAALERFDAAVERHGDRPELSYDRGLVLLAQGLRALQASDTEPAANDGLLDAARRAFEHASEAEELEVRASAFYERGNVAFDAEQWDAAIEAYIECLKARPDHSNAKWNLELARLRKQQDEDENEDEENEDEENEDEEDDGGTGGEDSGGEDSTGGSDDGGSTGGSDGGSDDGGSTGGGEDSGGETGQPPDDGTTGGQPEPEDDGQDTGEPPPDEGGTGEPPPPQPQPLDQLDLQKALDELDEQDHFPLDRPVGGVRPPTEDW